MAFNMSDFLNAESKKEMISDIPTKKISLDLLDCSDNNFYSANEEEIETLAKTIELVGLQQDLVVREKENGRFEILVGHNRYRALNKLVNSGLQQFEKVKCKIQPDDQTINELVLIFTNSTQRERTDAEKMKEIKRVKELLTEYKKTHKLEGRQSEIIAQILGTSKSAVGRLENIDRNLIDPLKQEFEKGKINTSTANKLASKEKEQQRNAYEEYKGTGKITEKEVKEAVELENIPAPELDKESLIIDGRINPHKEFDGIHIKDVETLLICCNQLDEKFWREWVRISNDSRLELLEAYSGITGTSGKLNYMFSDIVLNIENDENKDITAAIPLVDVREIINKLIAAGQVTVHNAAAPEEQYNDGQILFALKQILENRELLTEHEQCALMQIGRNVQHRTEE